MVSLLASPILNALNISINRTLRKVFINASTRGLRFPATAFSQFTQLPIWQMHEVGNG